MARQGRFDDFFDDLVSEVKDAGRAVLDRAEEGFDNLTDGIGNRVEQLGEGLADRSSARAERRQDRLEDRQERIEDGGVVAGIRERVADAADVAGEALDPLRDAARTVVNAAGAVVEVATLGAVDIEATEGEGLSASVGLLGREVGVAVDLDRSDGDTGFGVSADTALVGLDLSTSRTVADDGAAVTRDVAVGGRVGDLEGDAGVGVSRGLTAAGQRGVDLAAFAEALVDDELVRREAGVTVNRDVSDGQTGIDAGVFTERNVDGELTDRTEVGLTVNRDVSADQAGRDKGVVREVFDESGEIARDEAVTTINVGASDGQVELDIGVARESSAAGQETTRTEAGLFADFGIDDELIEQQSGFFRETEVGNDEATRSEIVTRSQRLGVDDGRLVQPSAESVGVGREEFADGQEEFSTLLGAEFSRGFNEEGHAEFGFDFVREVSVDGEEVVDDREGAFRISTDLTDADNIENIGLVFGVTGVPSEAIAGVFDGDARAEDLDLSKVERDDAGAQNAVVKKVASKAADFLFGTDEDTASTVSVFDRSAAEALAAAEPAPEPPVFDEPLFEPPVFEEPVFDEPAFEPPVFDDPGF